MSHNYSCSKVANLYTYSASKVHTIPYPIGKHRIFLENIEFMTSSFFRGANCTTSCQHPPSPSPFSLYLACQLRSILECNQYKYNIVAGTTWGGRHSCVVVPNWMEAAIVAGVADAC